MSEPAGTPAPDHIHDFRARSVTGFARLKKGRRRHEMVQHRACYCGLSERMYFHLFSEALGLNKKDLLR